MEFSPRVVALERWLAAGLVSAAVAVAALQWRSPLSRAIRADEPIAYRLSLQPGPRTFVAQYRPAERKLWVVYAPDPRMGEELPQLAFYAGRWPLDEPPIAGKAALKPLRPSTLWRLLRAQGDVPPLDRLLLAVELARMREDDVLAAWPPADGDLDAFWGKVGRASAPAQAARAITVEILNGTAKKGVASRVTKILRSKDADVLESGNAPQPRARTVLYDRVGRPAQAEWVRARLGCASAATATQLDDKSLVDVTVVLGDDCAQAGDE